MSKPVSETLLRAAGLLPADGDETAMLSIDIPFEEAIAPVVAVLGEILATLQKMDARLHRIENNTQDTFRAVMETSTCRG